MSGEKETTPDIGRALVDALKMEFNVLEDGTMEVWMPLIEESATFYGEVGTLQDFMKQKVSDHTDSTTSALDLHSQNVLLDYRKMLVECVMVIDQAIQKSPI